MKTDSVRYPIHLSSLRVGNVPDSLHVPDSLIPFPFANNVKEPWGSISDFRPIIVSFRSQPIDIYIFYRISPSHKRFVHNPRYNRFHGRNRAP
jgi:hypothetical protein